MEDNTLDVRILGLTPYLEADTLQRSLQNQRLEEKIPDTLLLLEHPNVITLGKRGSHDDIKVSPELLKAKGVELVETDRGGQNTVHAPGQLVGYIILHLYNKRKALRQFVCDLENSLIATLKAYGIHAYHHDEFVGVWTDKGKIAAIGISVNHGVTRHGFALNVNTAMDMFNLIVPCGIPDASLTSMKQWCNKELDIEEVSHSFIKKFSELKNYTKLTYN